MTHEHCHHPKPIDSSRSSGMLLLELKMDKYLFLQLSRKDQKTGHPSFQGAQPSNPSDTQSQYNMGSPPTIMHCIIDASPSPTDYVTGKIVHPTLSDAQPVPPKSIERQLAKSTACAINTASSQNTPLRHQFSGVVVNNTTPPIQELRPRHCAEH